LWRSPESANFAFLADYDAQLARLGALAERYFRDDPNTCLIKLRQFGELLAQQVAARTGVFTAADEAQVELLRRLKVDRLIPAEVADLFHQLRLVGNQAAHGQAGDHRAALTTLKLARQLGVWFHRAFGQDPQFSHAPFVPPPDPEAATAALHAELAELREALAASQSAAERARQLAEEQAQALETAAERARREAEERVLWEQLAQEAETAKAFLAARLAALQQAAQQAPAPRQNALLAAGQAAAQAIDLDEAATRTLIDR